MNNHPPTPFTGKEKPDKHPSVPIDGYCDYFMIIAILLGFCITQTFNFLKSKHYE